MNARVLIDGPSELVFDYAIPAGLNVLPGCRVRIPLRRKSATGTVLSVVVPEQADFALRELESLIDPEPLITPVLLRTGEWIARYYASSIESVIRSLLPEAVRSEENSAKTRRIAVLDAAPDPAVLEKLLKRAPRQHAVLSLLAAATDKRMPVADLGEGSAATLKSMEKAGLLRLEAEEVRRDPDADNLEEFIESKPLQLNSGQAAALDSVLAAVADPKSAKPILLLGVTGSGKTEVYLQAAQRALDLGKTVLVLVPEISLTPQTVRRFKSRFAAMRDQVAVLHSNLSQGERFDEWHRIRKGTARIVIGARSAVFAPLPDLGLILVDEEHENTYKQENVPRYHGRDVAVLRAAFALSRLLSRLRRRDVQAANLREVLWPRPSGVQSRRAQRLGVLANGHELEGFLRLIASVVAAQHTALAGLPPGGTEVPLGSPGEIAIRGPQVMTGYWNKPQDTAAVMTADGFFKSGDIGFMDSEGYVKIIDRKKDMIVISGFKVFPNELEEVIARLPGVLECAAIGVSDEQTGEAVKLFVVKKDPALTEQQIQAYCKEQLTNYKRPKQIVFKTDLPKSNVGKILRRELRELA